MLHARARGCLGVPPDGGPDLCRLSPLLERGRRAARPRRGPLWPSERGPVPDARDVQGSGVDLRGPRATLPERRHPPAPSDDPAPPRTIPSPPRPPPHPPSAPPPPLPP